MTVNQPPTIGSFTATPGTLNVGQSSNLAWTTTNATTCSIDNGVGSVGCNTNTNVSPAANTTYTLTATGPGGTTTATRSVTFNAPVITSFGLTFGQSCTDGPNISYTWTTSNATSAVLELRQGGNLISTTAVAANGSANGLFSICGETVTLVATGPGGSVSQTINAGN